MYVQIYISTDVNENLNHFMILDTVAKGVNNIDKIAILLQLTYTSFCLKMNAENDFVDRLNYNPYQKITAAYFNLSSLIINSKILLRLREIFCDVYF